MPETIVIRFTRPYFLRVCYLLHLLWDYGFVGVRLQVRDVRRVVGRGGGASVFATLQLSGAVTGWVVQAVVMHHGDHLLFDQLLGQLEVRQWLHGGGTQDRLVHLERREERRETNQHRADKCQACASLCACVCVLPLRVWANSSAQQCAAVSAPSLSLRPAEPEATASTGSF